MVVRSALVLLVGALTGTVTALLPSAVAISRRTLCAGLCLGSAAVVQAAPPLLRDGDSVRCENGTGAACDAAAEGNALILKLQERSRLNRVANEVNTRRRWEANVGYDDHFKMLGQKIVEKEGGGYMLMPEKEYNEMLRQSKSKK
ncbi:hypothetical protein T492DRAFT_880871 [Pavlovales sp. CCMP2436]|nr:hypothetical protein T492DRAFT_880871 [Pavlovales sp. CCMP2436]|mmetsp:Transcript_28570/g.66977  ORF Transcript_28570/g.66977 Transcript_28570/m.66977 type:complete len:145 (+) Transcript_28570:2150-2584(+)